MGYGINIGDVIAGRFRVLDVLGAGGMGMVVAAEHIELRSRVAIKIIHDGVAQNTESVARFIREGRAAACLQSQHAAKVFDVARLDSGAPFMVMEFLEGRDLEQLLEEQGAIPVTQAADHLLQACDALAEAHREGIVHRDLKPANLFLSTDSYGEPVIKVLDFGISKMASMSQESALTKDGHFMGSPLYMSPEQMLAPNNVDHRTDIWALGVVLFQLTTGRTPWGGSTVADVCGQVLRDPAPRVLELQPDLPPQLDAIVARCLQKTPQDRYQSVSELAMDLAHLGSAAGQRLLERVLLVSRGRGRAAQTLPAEALLPRVDDRTALASDQQSSRSEQAGALRATAGSFPPTAGTSPFARDGLGSWTVAAGVMLLVLAGVAVGTGVLLTRPGPAPVESVAAGSAVDSAPAASSNATPPSGPAEKSTVVIPASARVEVSSTAVAAFGSSAASTRRRVPAGKARTVVPPVTSPPPSEPHDIASQRPSPPSPPHRAEENPLLFGPRK